MIVDNKDNLVDYMQPSKFNRKGKVTQLYSVLTKSRSRKSINEICRRVLIHK